MNSREYEKITGLQVLPHIPDFVCRDMWNKVCRRCHCATSDGCGALDGRWQDDYYCNICKNVWVESTKQSTDISGIVDQLKTLNCTTKGISFNVLSVNENVDKANYKIDDINERVDYSNRLMIENNNNLSCHTDILNDISEHGIYQSCLLSTVSETAERIYEQIKNTPTYDSLVSVLNVIAENTKKQPINDIVLSSDDFKQLKKIGKHVSDHDLGNVTAYELLKLVVLANNFKI